MSVKICLANAATFNFTPLDKTLQDKFRQECIGLRVLFYLFHK